MAASDPPDQDQQLTVGTKDWADVILAMRQAAVDRFNSRRDLEWKLSFALWASLAVSANALGDGKVDSALMIGLIVGGLAIIGLHAWLATAFYSGGKRDRDDGIDFDKLLRKNVEGTDKPLSEKDYDWKKAHGIPVAITALLVAFVVSVAATAN